MHLSTITRNTAIRDIAISASEKTGIWQLALGLLAQGLWAEMTAKTLRRTPSPTLT